MLKSVSDNLDHGHVGIGSVVGEVQPCPEAWIVAKLVPEPADWKYTLAQCASWQVRENLKKDVVDQSGVDVINKFL